MRPAWPIIAVLALAFALAFGVAYLIGAEDGGEAGTRTVTRGLSTPAPATGEGAESLAIPALRTPPAPPAAIAPVERPPSGAGSAPPSGGAPVTPEPPTVAPDEGETEETLDI